MKIVQLQLEIYRHRHHTSTTSSTSSTTTNAIFMESIKRGCARGEGGRGGQMSHMFG